jgi:hypothetical protein
VSRRAPRPVNRRDRVCRLPAKADAGERDLGKYSAMAKLF